MAKFCIVGVRCGQVFRHLPRQWFETRDEAVEHAREIMARVAREGQTRVPSFIVAEAVALVEPEPTLPPVRVRDIDEAEDF